MPVRRHLILGGARCGKTRIALEHAARLAHELGSQVAYVATAHAHDAEMSERIARHQAERPPHWVTVEAPLQLAQALSELSAQIIVVDCLTLWLSNLLLLDFEESQPTAELPGWLRERQLLLEYIDRCCCTLLLVSNEVGGGIVPTSALARRFRDEQGWLNQTVARSCDHVTWVVAGIEMPLKPTPSN
jgi:adenosylcobinamide kinase / adenosylcobinamide-phosphate guanylyltransferase